MHASWVKTKSIRLKTLYDVNKYCSSTNTVATNKTVKCSKENYISWTLFTCFPPSASAEQITEHDSHDKYYV